MALKITSTPTLYGEDARQFLRRVRELQNVPAKGMSEERVGQIIQSIRRVLAERRSNA